MPEPEVDIEQEEGHDRVCKHFGYRKYETIAYNGFEHYLGGAQQQERRANHGEEEVLYHMHTEEVPVAYCVNW